MNLFLQIFTGERQTDFTCELRTHRTFHDRLPGQRFVRLDFRKGKKFFETWRHSDYSYASMIAHSEKPYPLNQFEGHDADPRRDSDN